ncbi:hypothetical protein FisN_29Hh130 [Fistulifera solaris]|jgi:hypothetical protein|uniref:Uncharacterized protein n=1 Tax=Fistulifera solaris TaxID=1519565 RepID=A0A1Z5K642_FISSO|nr:hypothetical protein FisN_29Hh130 [Fistulifera solaris]|eukprot:GAX21689.1 hypothetical protein FisN_29Hh130 [Fistulifera solaris]
MKAVALLPLLTALAREGQSQSLLKPSLPSARRLGRALQNSSALCTFDAFIAGECSYEQFCLPTEPNSAVYCQGLPTSTWTVEVVYFELCYDDFDDLEGDLYNASIPLPPDGYCSTERGLFTFEQEVLTSVSLNHTITAPFQSAVLEDYNVVACPDSELPDFVFGVNYCYDGCPLMASIDGTTCTGECTVCSDGVGLLNCSNLDPTFVYECSPDFTDDDIYEELLTYLGKEEETPNASPVTSPVETPVATPADTPAGTPVEEPPAASPTTNEEEQEPVAPVSPSNTTDNTSSSSAGMSGGFAVAFAVAVYSLFVY